MMRKLSWLAGLVALAALALPACGENGEEPESDAVVHVAGAWARSPMQDVGAVYFTAHNGGSAEDRLIGVSSPVAGRAEIHETVMEGGEASMRPVEHVTLVPDQEIAFEPGGYHVMLFDLSEPLEVDATITITLTFRNAGDVTVEAIVKPFVEDEGHMGDMGDG